MLSSSDTGSDINASNAGSGLVTFSFDDGWKCIYENGVPILAREAIKGTFYIISGYLDDFQYPQYMNEDELRALQQAGHEIGCHTVSHRHLPQEPTPLIEAEIMRSLEYLSKTGFPTETFAYPYGEYDERTISIVRNAGFAGARSTIPGFNYAHTNPFLLKVQAVKAKTSVKEVELWIRDARMKNAWLILMFHQIDEEGREWSATPETLQAIIRLVKRYQIRTETVSEGLKAMEMLSYTGLL